MIKSKLYPILIAFLVLIFPVEAQRFASEKNEIKPLLLKELKISNNLIYGISNHEGFYLSSDGGSVWTKGNNGLPVRRVYPFQEGEIKKITAIAYDVKNNERIIVSTPSILYLSENRGEFWEEIPLISPIKPSAYISSLSLDPDDKDIIIVGTSFSGIYESRDRGNSWRRISDTIPGLYRGAGFFEEITALSVSPYEKNRIYYLTGPTGELYSSNGTRTTWTEHKLPFAGNEIPLSIHFRSSLKSDLPDSPPYILEVRTNLTIWLFNPLRNRWYKDSLLPEAPLPQCDKAARMAKAAGKRGIYVSSWQAGGNWLDGHIQMVKERGMNSLIIDMKDDEGIITYDSKLELTKLTGAVKPRFKIKDLLERAHGEGLYVVARIPVFKDKVLFKYKKGAYALKEKGSGKPWGKLFEVTDEESGQVTYKQREHWVDPFSPFVWSYNVAIALELQSLGIDEVQFDYVRFPSDGDLWKIDYSHNREGMLRIEAIESFLSMAREDLSIPLSADLYGFNSWYRMGNWIGQSIDMVADYIDVISPMYYPSHFPAAFKKDVPYLERAEQIYREGTIRSRLIVGERALIRPYIQAFLVGKELKMELDEYTIYLELQLKGSSEGGASGFSLWNASNRYYMVGANFPSQSIFMEKREKSLLD